ncbi:hypothetical protein [[Mycobacterium] zoologicum]|uniref:hypothetical protein n=1 Tax=[Mycobacterium] zoologicum TaxID=2872311 RepID=UPI002BD00177|nr:hypothetical protein [Mycolicibacter sp. MYC101]MEB3063270.1 hypothetical protein [Mycolicibacter sp. MYC101]
MMATAPAGGRAGCNGLDVLPLYERPEFLAWLTASCERNNVPAIVTDPTVIGRIATLLGAVRPAGLTVHTRRTRRARSISTPKIPEAPEAMTA